MIFFSAITIGYIRNEKPKKRERNRSGNRRFGFSYHLTD